MQQSDEERGYLHGNSRRNINVATFFEGETPSEGET